MVAFVASATDTNTSGVDETSITITKPTGTLENHYMVAVVAGYLPATLTAPTGWVLMYGPVADATGLYSWVYQKKAGAAEGANYTWTWSGVGGALNGSISTFSSASGIDAVNVTVTSTTDPAPVTTIQTTRDAIGYAVYCWRDTTIDTCTTTGGTGVSERFDVGALDVGTIARGQAGYTHTVTEDYFVTSSMFSINPTNSVTHGIVWSMAIGDAAASNESWASSGFGVELNLNDTWTDITTHIRASDGIQIKRGSSSESSQFEPSQLTLMLDNTDGRFSPRNPTGTYFGQIGRNTPVRVHKAYGTVALQLEGERGDYIRTIGNNDLDITGDIDIRIDLEPRAWKQAQTLVAKHEDHFGTLVWRFYLDEEGFLKFTWSNDGVSEVATVTSTLPVPMVIRQAVRVTLDVNNGAAGNTATFYYANNIDSSWTQLGSTVVTSGTTSFYSYPAPVMIGQTKQTIDQGQYAPNLHALVYGFELYSGIAGTKQSDVDFTGQTTGTYSLTENDNLWLCQGNAVISNRRYRFHGEISEWPARWDSTGTDIYVPIEGAGISRRLGRGSDPLKSAMFRFCSSEHDDFTGVVPDTNTATPIAYWPFEDSSGASVIASGLSNGVDMTFKGGTPTFTAYDGFKASDSLMAFTTGVNTYGRVTGSTAGGFQLDFLLSAPSGITNGAVICRVNMYGPTGDILYVELTYPSTDNLQLIGYDDEGSVVFNSAAFGVPIAGDLNLITVHMYQDGSDIQYAVYSREITASSATLEVSGTSSSRTLDRVTSIEFGRSGQLNDVYIGHAVVWEISNDASNIQAEGVNAYLGEDAATRVQRLCREEGIEFRQVGNTNSQADLIVFFNGDGTPMGYQTPGDFLDLLNECRDSEGGFLYEPREVLGLGFRTLDSLYQLPARLTVDYSLFQLSGDLWPTEDDQKLVNVMTVSRKDGSSYIYEKTSGTLSTQNPPNGVGRYTNSASLSLETDDLAATLAGWYVHLGTVDEARFPKVDLALENPRFTASSSLTEGLLKLDIGDRIVIDNPPSWLPPEDISLIVVGYTESFDKYLHDFSLVCVPASPYVNVGVVEVSETGRVDTDASSLSASATSGATSISVATTDAYVWIDSATYSSDFPFDIMVGGERMTVTAITGTTSPQTFTVTRSVNGVTKTHASGTEVHVFQPIYVGL